MKVEYKSHPPPPPPGEYVITLTEEEALHLCRILGCLGGDVYPERSVTDDLWADLCRLLPGEGGYDSGLLRVTLGRQ